MLSYYFKYPTLVQACLSLYCNSCRFLAATLSESSLCLSWRSSGVVESEWRSQTGYTDAAQVSLPASKSHFSSHLQSHRRTFLYTPPLQHYGLSQIPQLTPSWTVQTFLLSSTYSFSSLSIGLMGLLGFVGAVVAPFSGKLVDAVVPWLAQLIGLSLSFSGMLIALFTAEKSVVAVAISVTMFDVGNQLFQVSSSYRVAGLDPKARARLNGCVLLALFAGQVSCNTQSRMNHTAPRAEASIWGKHRPMPPESSRCGCMRS